MNVKDDVPNSPAPPRSRRPWILVAPLLGAALAIAAATLAPPARLPLHEARLEWGARPVPAPPAGLHAALEGPRAAGVLVLRGHRAAAVRAYAGEVAAQRAAAPEAFEAALATLESAWAGALAGGPDPEPAAAVAIPALLRADAAVRVDLARALPRSYAASARTAAANPPVDLRARADAVRRAAAAGDPAALAAALDQLAAGEAAWFASGIPARTAPVWQRGSAWRRYQLERAAEHGTTAEAAAAALSPDTVRLVHALARTMRLERGRAAAVSFLALAEGGPASIAVPVRPVAPAWGLWLAAAGLAGALAGLLAVALARPRRSLRMRSTFAPDRTPADPGPWLHIVTGPNARAIARATLEVAAQGLARHERVLVMDAGPRLALHEVFEREPRWGLMECLRAEMPVLGLVQYGGRPGLYLLAHGNGTRGEGWSRLGQCLDDTRPHFRRVVLALEPQAPRPIGEALVGRPFEAWWAEPAARLPRVAMDWVSRMGIALSGMDLSGIPEATLEVLRDRVAALEPLPMGTAWEHVVEASEPPANPLPRPQSQEVVLDCDLQVRERLRFLAWMRRVQKESRRRAEAQAITQV